MNSNQNLPDKDKVSEEIEDANTLSIDEFFRQLEERERDLHISSTGTTIEIDDTDVSGTEYAPDFIKKDFLPAASETTKPNTNGFAPKPAVAPSANLDSQIANLQNKIAKLETERGEIIEISRRRQIDFETYKKRIERERSDTFRSQLGNLATQMLPVLDNLNRALDAASDLGEENPQSFQQFFEGIMLVNQQLSEVLEEMGVQPIVAVGETFDPHFHEAVATDETSDAPPHTITAELLRGYRIDDRVIRPSMVKVSK